MKRAWLLVLIATSGCALGDPEDPNVVPMFDAATLDTARPDTASPDTTAPDASTPEDTFVADASAPDTFVADTFAPDTFVPDTFVADTSVADTFKPDTFVADTFVPDTFVPDTFVPDTFTPDTSVADTFVPDTFVPDTFVADTFVLDTFVPDTFVADTFVPDTFVPPPWRHTITIDGTSDFAATTEQFTTTSSAYRAYVTWDATAIYVGYGGPDIATGSATKWLFVYLDVDPGTGLGASIGETYRTQHPKFPTGFGAEHYFAWKTNDSFSHFKSYAAGAWTTVSAHGVTLAKSGDFVEMRIPRVTLGTPSKIGVVAYMINEQEFLESTYAGLYSTSFTDGYAMEKTIGNYLLVDLLSPDAPNAAANKKP